MTSFTPMLSMPPDSGAMLVSVGLTLVTFYSDGFSARAVPQRGVKSIFYYVRRARDSLGKAGKWLAAEDEQLLR
jgi:hypothetical protein